MYQRLKQKLKKQNDISQYQRQKKIKLQTQQYAQGINYSQAKFFSNCEQFFNNVKQDAKNQQIITQHQRKMKKYKQLQQQKSIKTTQSDNMLIFNIIIDYFRSYNMNYSYSVIMRQKNMISDDIVLKNDLINLLNLHKQYKNDQRFNVSIIELLMKKMKHYQNLFEQKNYQTNQSGIQCDIITNYNKVNNILLTQIKLQQIRKQTQLKQKKHYQNMIHHFKSNQLIKLKQDMLKLYENKQKKITQKYEQKIKQLINKNKQQTKSDIQLRKQQEYLNQIQSLTKQIRGLKQNSYSLQKHKLSHNCLQSPQIKQKLQQISIQRKQLNEKRKQFQLAIMNMDTKVQDLYQQKTKIINNTNKSTQQYLHKMKQHKQNKDYMIQKVYGTLRGFEKRIEQLSKDNVKQLEQNQILKAQINLLKRQDKQITSIPQQGQKKSILLKLNVHLKMCHYLLLLRNII